MGSVPSLYTTGDNDPQIEPEQYYRHYLYCDACGSFELAPWTEPEDLKPIETSRQRLATAALLIVPVAVAAIWQWLGLVPSLTILTFLAADMGLGMLLLGFVWRFWGSPPPFPERKVLRYMWKAFLVFAIVAVTEWVANTLDRPWIVLAAAAIALATVLITREILPSRIKYLGLGCRQCAATYAYGTPFFTDLDANPRHLTVTDVPRPLGSSPFERGAAVDYQPPEPPGRLPA